MLIRYNTQTIQVFEQREQINIEVLGDAGKYEVLKKEKISKTNRGGP